MLESGVGLTAAEEVSAEAGGRITVFAGSGGLVGVVLGGIGGLVSEGNAVVDGLATVGEELIEVGGPVSVGVGIDIRGLIKRDDGAVEVVGLMLELVAVVACTVVDGEIVDLGTVDVVHIDGLVADLVLFGLKVIFSAFLMSLSLGLGW